MVPHLAEELHSYLPQKTTDSFFKEQHTDIKTEWRNENLNKFMEVVLDIKSEINKEFGSETLGVAVNVRLPLILFRNLLVNSLLCVVKLANSVFQDISAAEIDLADVFQVANVQIEENTGFPEEYNWTSCKSCLHLCNRCRRVASDVADELCERCKSVIDAASKRAVIS